MLKQSSDSPNSLRTWSHVKVARVWSRSGIFGWTSQVAEFFLIGAQATPDSKCAFERPYSKCRASSKRCLGSVFRAFSHADTVFRSAPVHPRVRAEWISCHRVTAVIERAGLRGLSQSLGARNSGHGNRWRTRVRVQAQRAHPRTAHVVP